jgi:large subunit ribosomal protein L25
VSDYVIEAEVRTVTKKKVNRLRKQGLVPATVYGAKIEPVSIQIPYRPLEVALLSAGGTNLIDLKAGKQTHTVLVRDVQREVLKGTILHVDFFAVDETTTIRAAIPIHIVGESPVVEARQGILVTGSSAVTIETLPSKLMDRIEIDITSLVEIGDSILVGDLDLGDDIVIVDDPHEMLARISQPSAARAEEELEAEGEEEEEEELEGSAEPEVISRGKAEEEEE